MKRPTSRTLSPGGWTLVILLAARALWAGAAAAGHVDEFFFSRPSLLLAEWMFLVE